MDFPELETERLILRAVAPGDRFAIFENYSDPDVAGWFFDQPYTRIQQADQIIQEFIQNLRRQRHLVIRLGTCSRESLLLGARLYDRLLTAYVCSRLRRILIHTMPEPGGCLKNLASMWLLLRKTLIATHLPGKIGSAHALESTKIVVDVIYLTKAGLEVL